MRCQWIPREIDPRLADDLDVIFCGRPTRDRSCPWCDEHLSRVFRHDGMSDEAEQVEQVEQVEEDEDAA